MLPSSSAGPPAQVVVLGMHRSGTSAITNVLRRMGLWAGEKDDFPPADGHNQAGYWEHRGIWAVDEAILHSLGASWSEVADLDLSRLEERARARLQQQARETLRALDRHGSWVIKDPRLCLLFPFWREILERPFCILIYRDPLPVARSLAARDGFSIPLGIALWEKYNREALASSRGLPRVLVSHRELMENPAAMLGRLHRELAQHRPELAELHVPTEEESRAILDPDLVHHPHDSEAERQYLTLPQLDLLDALENGSALGLDPVPPLSPGARDLLAAHQSLLATQQSLLTANQSLLTAHQSLLTANQSLQNLMADKAKGAADLHRALSWVEELNAIISALLESRSWKIGSAVTGATRRFLGPARTSAAQRRDRVMADVRRWRSGEK